MNIRDVASWGLHGSGMGGLGRKLLVRDGRFALNFHGVSSHRYPNIGPDLQPHHSISEFLHVLEWLAPRFTFLSVDDFFRGSRPGILLTFDDGHANNLINILPLLEKFKAQGLFFISTQHVRNSQDWLPFVRQDAVRGWGGEANVPDDFSRDCYDGLSESQLTELAWNPWAVIGSHTVTHPSLPKCNPEQIANELVESRRYLQKVSGQSVDYFAYPYGDYNFHTAVLVRDAGYRAAFAVDSRHVGLPIFEIPRVGIYDYKIPYLDLKLSGLYRTALRGSILA